MNENIDWYCKVYLDSPVEKIQIVNLITRVISGSVKLRTISSPQLQVDLVANEDFDQSKRLSERDDFLFYRYYLDVEPTDGVAFEQYVHSVSILLEGLWQSGCKAVAACDFEDKLPHNGGYYPPTEGQM